MKKHRLLNRSAAIAVMLFFILTVTSVNAQLFSTGDKILNLTLGIGSPYVLNHVNYRTVLPPVALSLDYGFRDDVGPGVIGIGGIVAATTYKNRYTYFGWDQEYGYKATSAFVALRGTYHYEFIDKLDTYGGVHIGMRFVSWKEYGDFPLNYEPQDFDVRPVLNLFAGARYYFSDQLAALVEIGYHVAYLNVGISYKL